MTGRARRAASPTAQEGDHPHQVLVLCSAYVDDDLEREARVAGFAAVVPKEEITSLPERLLRAAGS